MGDHRGVPQVFITTSCDVNSCHMSCIDCRMPQNTRFCKIGPCFHFLLSRHGVHLISLVTFHFIGLLTVLQTHISDKCSCIMIIDSWSTLCSSLKKWKLQVEPSWSSYSKLQWQNTQQSYFFAFIHNRAGEHCVEIHLRIQCPEGWPCHQTVQTDWCSGGSPTWKRIRWKEREQLDLCMTENNMLTY